MNVLIPLPKKHFDPTEAAIPWRVLKQAKIKVTFATPDGKAARGDQRMIDGKGLGILSPLLSANKNGRYAYLEMSSSKEFQKPIKWTEIKSANYDGIVLPGGHAKGMREYLESPLLQKIVSEFFKNEKPVGAICHGVVLAGRSHMEGSNKSVLSDRKTTSLLAQQELLAWKLTRAWLGNYYRTYRQTVEDEVKSYLTDKSKFITGPKPFLRDSPEKLDRGFTVVDRNYVSARWPGDAHKFSKDFLEIFKRYQLKI